MMQKRKSRPRRLLRNLVLLMLALALGFGGGTVASRVLHEALEDQQESVSQDAAQQSPTSSPESAPNATDTPAPTSGSGDQTFNEWSQESAPNYYRVLGAAQVGEVPDVGEVRYGELDRLGRTTGVVAAITFDMMEEGLARQRGDLSSLTPSGWGHNREVDMAMPDGTIYHGFLYNRSHLLAKSLGGDDGLHNLITATRTQNVGANVDGSEGGMAHCEGLARDWLWAHRDGTLFYQATPVHQGNELVARCVVVDLLSSDGTLSQRIQVFNAARGFAIDYATGEFEVTESAEEAAASIREQLETRSPGSQAEQVEEVAPVTPQGSSESEDGERMVFVTGSGKAYHHDETCSGLAQARSMRWVTLSEAEEMGRHPCGICGG